MTTSVVRSGSVYRLVDQDNEESMDALPAGVYILKYSQLSGFYLDRTEDFSLPEKLYATTRKDAARIVNTFNDRPSVNTGVLMSGEKGSGKSLLAKVVSSILNEVSVPTIIINAAYTGTNFDDFIISLPNRCMILFDEFEKTYSKIEEQETLLTLLDGTCTSVNLFIFTVNNRYKISDNLVNRPGRIFYAMQFEGLSVEFIEEYCQDRLTDQSQISSVVKMTAIIGKFNFDMLQALVEEMNRYHEDPMSAAQMLNIRVMNTSDYYNVEMSLNGKPFKTTQDTCDVNPLHNSGFSITVPGKTDDDDSEEILFSVMDIVAVNSVVGSYVFTNKLGYTLTLTAPRISHYDYRNSF